MSSRNPLQQIGDMVGLYAYLVATGNLRYWPALRRSVVEEESLRYKSKPQFDKDRDRVAGY